MRPTLQILFTLCLASQATTAELIVHQNTNPDFGVMKLFDPNGGNTIYGQSLDITRSAFDQPVIGQTPAASLFFMHTTGLIGDFTWMGMGNVTTTARSTIGTPIPDPWANHEVDYFGPQAFSNGDTVDAQSNFVDGWRTIHGFNHLTGPAGIFTVAETFTVGVRFDVDGQDHYGFATFARDYDVRNGELRVEITPLRWGYETVAGLGAGVVPAPGAPVLLGIGLAGAALRRQRG